MKIFDKNGRLYFEINRKMASGKNLHFFSRLLKPAVIEGEGPNNEME